MSDCVMRVKTVSGAVVEFPIDTIDDMQNAVGIVEKKDTKGSFGSFTGLSTTGVFYVIPLSDVAHVGFVDVPKDWLM